MPSLTKFLRPRFAALFAAAFLVQQPGPGIRGNPSDNGAAARTYMSSLRFGDNLPDSQTVYTQFVWGSNAATVKIVPVAGANKISWQTALADGGNGVFVAKIYNVDNQNIGPLGINQGANGYLWIGDLGNGERGAAIYSIKKDGTIEANPKKLQLGGFCPGQHDYAAVRITDGTKCKGAFTQGQTSASNRPIMMLASMKHGSPLRFAPGGGLWVSCVGGCCEVKISADGT
jgi:hypothetical protein